MPKIMNINKNETKGIIDGKTKAIGKSTINSDKTINISSTKAFRIIANRRFLVTFMDDLNAWNGFVSGKETI